MATKYPKHFYEPIRIKIATSQMQHDLRKLLPSLNPEDWNNIDNDVSEWFAGEKFELEPIHDFWNFFEGFARGLKLKNLTSWITAENVVWSIKEVLVEEIFIVWDFPGLEFMGKAPFNAGQAAQILKTPKMKKQRERIKQDSTMRSDKFPPRDQFPIVLFKDIKGGIISSHKGYYALEGNRRTIKAIVNDQKKILSYVGRFKNSKDKYPENYWFRTGTLRDLISLANRYDKQKDKKSFEIVRKFYQLLLRDFDIARIATIDESFKSFERNDKFLRDLLSKELK